MLFNVTFMGTHKQLFFWTWRTYGCEHSKTEQENGCGGNVRETEDTETEQGWSRVVRTKRKGPCTAAGVVVSIM